MDYNAENKSFMKEKEIFNKIIAERNNRINNLKNELKSDKLTHYFQSEESITISFNNFKRLLGLTRKIKMVL